MRGWVLVIVLASTLGSSGDILHLRDGSRHYGQLVSEEEEAVQFRLVLRDGTSGMVQTFLRAQIVRIERTGRVDTPPAPPGPSAGAGRVRPDRAQMLREAFELFDDGAPGAAVRAMQRGVVGASEVELGELDALTRRLRGIPLDTLLATARVYVAGRAGHGRGFRLRFATRYEQRALAAVLADQAAVLLGREHLGKTVAQWAVDWREYAALHDGARRLVADAVRAAGLISARLRYDEQLRQDRAETARWTRLRRDLTDAAAHIGSMTGYLELPPEDGWEDPACPLVTKRAAASQPAESRTGAANE
jgi:hypothetical protein